MDKYLVETKCLLKTSVQTVKDVKSEILTSVNLKSKIPIHLDLITLRWE